MSTSASGGSKAQLGLPSCRWLATPKAASAESVAGRVPGVWALLLSWDAMEQPTVLPIAFPGATAIVTRFTNASKPDRRQRSPLHTQHHTSDSYVSMPQRTENMQGNRIHGGLGATTHRVRRSHSKRVRHLHANFRHHHRMETVAFMALFTARAQQYPNLEVQRRAAHGGLAPPPAVKMAVKR